MKQLKDHFGIAVFDLDRAAREALHIYRQTLCKMFIVNRRRRRKRPAGEPLDPLMATGRAAPIGIDVLAVQWYEFKLNSWESV